MKVLKFGGSSLADAAQVNRAAALIKAEKEPCFVVVSAPGKRFAQDQKITDLLYVCAELAERGESIDEPFAAVERRYQEICRELGLDGLLDEELKAAREAVGQGAGRDYAASRGEYLCGRLMAAFLQVPFVDAAEVIAFRADGKLDEAGSCQALSRRLAGLRGAVIPGFYGARPDGSIQTFSRGGSDITGAVVAKGVGACVYENWTDVSGVLMADPRIVETPQVIRELSYGELEKLAAMGAAVMHPEAVAPARTAGIPIHIRNTNVPEDPGTWISRQGDRKRERDAITGIAGRTGFSGITLEKKQGEAGFDRRVRYALKAAHLDCACQSGDGNRVFVLVPTAALAQCREHLPGQLMRVAQADTVTIEDGLALLGVVGRAAGNAAGRLAEAVERQEIHVRMVDRASRKDVLVSVRETDYLQAFRALYQAAVCC